MWIEIGGEKKGLAALKKWKYEIPLEWTKARQPLAKIARIL